MKLSWPSSLARAFSRVALACVLALATGATGSALAFDLGLVMPAVPSAGLVAKRQLTPSSQPQLTSALLQAYVERQSALRAFDAFGVDGGGKLTEDVLSSYIARKRNPALEAIAAVQLDLRPSISPDVLADYVQTGFHWTGEKIEVATKEKDCLAMAIYHEARGESTDGQMAVGNVIVNRALSKKFPSTLCGVIFENADKGRYRCQFTFACDGRSDVGTERKAWAKAEQLADEIYRKFAQGKAPGILPNTALYYHTRAVSPDWSSRFTRVASIGAHLFYASN